MPRMKAFGDTVAVRMYRQGHGDCFLLAFPGETRDGPVYVLIDCGLKPGSEVHGGLGVENVIADIGEATGNHIHVVVVTHEHQDHVNGFVASAERGGQAFDAIAIDQVWLGWTEDGDDPFANALRRRFEDTLLGLVWAELRLAAEGSDPSVSERIRELVELETGIDGGAAALAAALSQPGFSLEDAEAFGIKGISNKRAIKRLRDRARVRFLRPDGGPYDLPGTKGVQVFALGPPRNETLLLSLDPEAGEGFPDEGAHGLALSGADRSFLQACAGTAGNVANLSSPFAPRYCITAETVFDADEPRGGDWTATGHYRTHYGPRLANEHDPARRWRRIDTEWLDRAEVLALRLNHEVNNTSLVLAIELPKTRKVLLFSGDAQRGSWISWADLEWSDGGRTVTAADLLARTVLYKVGHHGSHNATLDGRRDDKHPNLAWMADGIAADEFVAMIPANSRWALAKSRPWKHPLEAIEKALMAKAFGRVFRSDLEFPERPKDTPSAEWTKFKRRCTPAQLYHEVRFQDA